MLETEIATPKTKRSCSIAAALRSARAALCGDGQRYLFADERGSIVAVTEGNGPALAINTYDEYGIPGAANQGRFQYTGQTGFPELGMCCYNSEGYVVVGHALARRYYVK